ncbi:MAG: hypothetical protein LQ350_000310 [Teloschistes chrysophthalmus]|nr:MAG: hypothetical protein LQ350_000310 [Niorma chrysophthalma]
MSLHDVSMDLQGRCANEGLALQPKDEWCFGMITGLCPVVSPQLVIKETPINFRLLDDGTTLHDIAAGQVFGTISSRTKSITNALSKELSLQIYGDYSVSRVLKPAPSRLSKGSKNAERSPIHLNLVIYGPYVLFEPVGIFAAKCGIYLQHPRHCDRNVPYRNPQCLSLEKSLSLSTYDLLRQFTVASPVMLEGPLNPIDLFLDGGQREHLSEARTPSSVETTLYKHQRQALMFMMQRESGWALDGRYQDIWKAETDEQGQKFYSNYITGQTQMRPPEQFRGGLLIDAPGLGKSLSILALIAADLEGWNDPDRRPNARRQTLLVVPKSLIETWKDELVKHLKLSSTIRSREYVYYGKGRKELFKSLDEYTLVITTYAVVRMDWKESSKRGDLDQREIETLHDVCWRRIVLDEAHIAREPSKTFAKSVCALRADRRWAVTGTPIQNRLTDLYSLFKFLQCYPFSNLKVFNSHVTQNWKASDPIAVAKLKNLVNCLSIGRPKDTVQLPPRNDVLVPIQLGAPEEQLYRAIVKDARHSLDIANGDNLFNTLRQVNLLRLVCNHGLQSSGSDQYYQNVSTTGATWAQRAAQWRFDHLDALGLAQCSNPACKQDLSSSLLPDTDHEHEDEPYIEKDLTLLCSGCHEKGIKDTLNYIVVCHHSPRQYSGNAGAEFDDLFDRAGTLSMLHQHQGTLVRPDYVPPKIERSLGLDGTMSSTSRAKTLRTFRNDNDIRVLLATISCGGVGLDLTAASRAFIIEPQWNPMSESQALDRVHRLGQTKEVILTRYITIGTWEQKVVTVQRKKQELADLTLGSGPIDKAKLTSGRMQYLKHFID